MKGNYYACYTLFEEEKEEQQQLATTTARVLYLYCHAVKHQKVNMIHISTL